jgi:hypothetical protein
LSKGEKTGQTFKILAEDLKKKYSVNLFDFKDTSELEPLGPAQK